MLLDHLGMMAPIVVDEVLALAAAAKPLDEQQMLTAFLLLLLPRTIRAPLTKLTEQVDALSKGIPIDGDDDVQIKEFRSLAQAVARMATAQKMLLERVKRIRTAA